ncbi:glycosyltransferase family 2 protein [Paraburkholderia kirstenboschensis]|uniref:Glycosyltransferase family 2 protein n=1 Tax=Paraburkholderia kirstenboschensis TaxID=1245436 RepID=A0ABZ0E9Z2_9BURK|nr:glycosyltransferase family 2 protein [Paraburkholderia kirstenboschensis]WOD14037.1 glycosyltransferase family 2 protein [Paraburkholderia kirstenboschensis]
MIVIPMAGNSSRFYAAGFSRPKYELEIGGQSLFSLTVRSFEAYFESEKFLFIVRAEFAAKGFVEESCRALGVSNYEIVELATPTRGQAETVLLGMTGATYRRDEALLVFNVDTIRPGYTLPPEAANADGYLEVFRAQGDHWSFVRPLSPTSKLVAATAEKRRISDLCCTGLYYFASAADFVSVCTAAIDNFSEFEKEWRELYIAPMYNALIAKGRRITYHEVPASEVLLAGTPDEFEALVSQQVQT